MFLVPPDRARRALALALLLASLPFGQAIAAGKPRAPAELRTLAQRRAAVYFGGLKEIRDAAMLDGVIRPERRDDAQAIWSRIAAVPSELDALAREARESAASDTKPPKDAARTAAEIERLAATARRLDARYRPVLGTPAAAPAVSAIHGGSSPGAPSESAARYFITGQVSAGGGNARFRPLDSGAVAQDAGTLDLQMRGGIRPNADSDLSVRLGRTRRVEQLAVAQTEAGARFDQRVGARLRWGAELAYHGYGEDDSDVRDYGETRLRASGQYQLAPSSAADVAISRDSRSYSKSGAANFSSSRLDGTFRHTGGSARLEGRLSLQRRSAETKAAGFTRREPAIRLESNGPGSPSGVAAAYETYDYDESPLAASRRLKLEGYVGRGKSGRTGASFVRFDRPSLPDSLEGSGYDDLVAFTNDRSRDSRGSRSKENTLAYRRHHSEAVSDFFDVAMHRRREAGGAWIPRREVHVTARGFIRKDGAPVEQHFADISTLLGWDFAAPERCSVGLDLITGGRAFIDPDRASHQDFGASGGAGETYDPNAANNFNPDDDHAWQNPRNTLRLGSAARISRNGNGGLGLDARLRLDRNFLYNASPPASRTDLAIDLNARYPLALAWLAEAGISVFHSRSSEGASGADFDRTVLQLRATYLFQLSGGTAR